MPEPIISPAAATLAATTATVPALGIISQVAPVLQVWGVPIGLRVDILFAGFLGAMVAIILLNTVPATGDTWPHLIRSTFRRMFVALASSVTAGYLTPLVLLLASLQDAVVLGVAFAVGAGAQKMLLGSIRRLTPVPVPSTEGQTP